MNEIKTNKDEVNNKYLKKLAERLEEVRNDNNLSQKDLAKKTNIIREKILYAELNIKGRKLQIEELAEIAYKLNVSLDYLVGLTDEKTSISKKEVSNDESIKSKKDNSITELESVILEEVKKEDNEEIYQFYKSIVYITRNTLTITLGKIKPLIQRKSTLSSAYINNISSAYYFIIIMLNSNMSVLPLNDKQRMIMEKGAKALGNILNYNQDKELPMFYEDIETMREELKTINDYLFYTLSDCKIKKQIEKNAMENIQNERYYQKTNEFISEYGKTHKK